ncbi:uncharacterized protein K441DRAFT_64953 [Cenococcum geophilum 1.58]|uniref:uncharacterized protein n=1 Tax=Cenococcum geophilum 1.58 TaxID=794803 RepID=UPI00358F5F03|nr:hypothetical protein K441DRAFT_64953 [Cenococcum geophilum 1.58]
MLPGTYYETIGHAGARTCAVVGSVLRTATRLACTTLRRSWRCSMLRGTTLLRGPWFYFGVVIVATFPNPHW